jgi:UDP-galactopyranose mutase
LKDWATSKVGDELYERIIAGYTEKQWGMPAELLPSSIIQRIPIRTDLEDRYFLDKHQGIPIEGYEKLVLNQLDSSYITVELETDFFDVQECFDNSQTIVYTGPIDQYFHYSKGELGWRTLDFEFEQLPIRNFQNCAIQNFADIEIPYTRIHEFKHLHPEREILEDVTVICREFSRQAEKLDEKFYPIRTVRDMEILQEYRDLSKKLTNVYFGGRLGSYKYLDMHMAIGQAFELFDRLKLHGRVA